MVAFHALSILLLFPVSLLASGAPRTTIQQSSDNHPSTAGRAASPLSSAPYHAGSGIFKRGSSEGNGQNRQPNNQDKENDKGNEKNHGNNKGGDNGKGHNDSKENDDKDKYETATRPVPSGRPKDKNSGNKRRHSKNVPRALKGKGIQERNVLEMSGQLCPEEFFACPIAEAGSLYELPSSLAAWGTQGYECIDVTADLRACGGCSALDARHDCLAIPGAQDVACVNSNCQVDSCLAGYVLSREGSHCVKV